MLRSDDRRDITAGMGRHFAVRVHRECSFVGTQVAWQQIVLRDEDDRAGDADPVLCIRYGVNMVVCSELRIYTNHVIASTFFNHIIGLERQVIHDIELLFQIEICVN